MWGKCRACLRRAVLQSFLLPELLLFPRNWHAGTKLHNPNAGDWNDILIIFQGQIICVLKSICWVSEHSELKKKKSCSPGTIKISQVPEMLEDWLHWVIYRVIANLTSGRYSINPEFNLSSYAARSRSGNTALLRTGVLTILAAKSTGLPLPLESGNI